MDEKKIESVMKLSEESCKAMQNKVESIVAKCGSISQQAQSLNMNKIVEAMNKELGFCDNLKEALSIQDNLDKSFMLGEKGRHENARKIIQDCDSKIDRLLQDKSLKGVMETLIMIKNDLWQRYGGEIKSPEGAAPTPAAQQSSAPAPAAPTPSTPAPSTPAPSATAPQSQPSGPAQPAMHMQPQQPPQQQPPQQQPQASPEQKDKEKIIADVKRKIAEAKSCWKNSFPKAKRLLGTARKQAAGISDDALKEEVESTYRGIEEEWSASVDATVEGFMRENIFLASERTDQLVEVFRPRAETAEQLTEAGRDKSRIKDAENGFINGVSRLLGLVGKDKDKMERIKAKIVERLQYRKGELNDDIIGRADEPVRKKILEEKRLPNPKDDAEMRVYCYSLIIDEIDELNRMIPR